MPKSNWNLELGLPCFSFSILEKSVKAWREELFTCLCVIAKLFSIFTEGTSQTPLAWSLHSMVFISSHKLSFLFYMLAFFFSFDPFTCAHAAQNQGQPQVLASSAPCLNIFYPYCCCCGFSVLSKRPEEGTCCVQHVQLLLDSVHPVRVNKSSGVRRGTEVVWQPRLQKAAVPSWWPHWWVQRAWQGSLDLRLRLDIILNCIVQL